MVKGTVTTRVTLGLYNRWHKLEGKQFLQIFVNLELEKQKSLHKCQLYVTFSRVTSLEGLDLTGYFNMDHMTADEVTIE